MSWFQRITGFDESEYKPEFKNNKIINPFTNEIFNCGYLEQIPTDKLLQLTIPPTYYSPSESKKINIIQGEIPEIDNSVYLIYYKKPNHNKYHEITNYLNDNSKYSACVMSTPAATIYRCFNVDNINGCLIHNNIEIQGYKSNDKVIIYNKPKYNVDHVFCPLMKYKSENINDIHYILNCGFTTAYLTAIRNKRTTLILTLLDYEKKNIPSDIVIEELKRVNKIYSKFINKIILIVNPYQYVEIKDKL